MSFKNVFFVGYFLQNKSKQEFADLFKCNNKIFLESSIHYIKINAKKIKYFPSHIFMLFSSRAGNLLFNSVRVDQLLIKLYKRDLKIYLTSYIDVPLPIRKGLFFLIVYWTFLKEFKKRSYFNPIGYLLIMWAILRKRHVPVGQSYCDVKALKLLAFRLSFLSGYLYIDKLLLKLKPNNDDLFILWGAENTGLMLLIERLKKMGIHYFISEYGEIPDTYSVNKKGIFGDSFIADNWKKIIESETDDSAKRIAEVYNNRLRQNLSEPPEVKKKAIYVSGVELIASGHLFNKDFYNKNTKNANNMLLSHVVAEFGSKDYDILYKDHPLMQENYKGLTLNPLEFPSVHFLNSLSVDDLIIMSDITITLPSKVAMTCLLYRKPVYVFGKFSIPINVPELGYYTGNNIGEINDVVDETKIDKGMYTKVIAQFIHSYLVCINSPLFDQYDYENETKKLDNIIRTQIKIEAN